MGSMQRVVIVGPGAAGKSTLAARLSQITGLPVVELDKLFWRPGLIAPAPGSWAAIERDLVVRPSWIIDGDLGPYDVSPQIRLEAADTIVFLDFSPRHDRAPVTAAPGRGPCGQRADLATQPPGTARYRTVTSCQRPPLRLRLLPRACPGAESAI